MSKLFELKEYLTLDEAVNHLSSALGETVTLADIYRLSLNSHLKLTAHFFNYVDAKKVTIIEAENLLYRKGIPNHSIEYLTSKRYKYPLNGKYPISKDYWVQDIGTRSYGIKGLWDLTMLGDERLDIEHRYQQETSGHSVNEMSTTGVYLQQGDNFCQLQTSVNVNHQDEGKISHTKRDKTINIGEFNEVKLRQILQDKHPYRGIDFENNFIELYKSIYFSAKGLDDQENVLVVRTAELTRFIQSLEEKQLEAKPLHDKERTTLLILLGSILSKANFDLLERGVVGKIQRATELNNTPVSEQTIRDLLPLLRETLELKQKN